ncbi:band 7 protein [Desulfofarcimen acetoxidans DSM 771]|uniref:Band 7 protein n=1 Tax=Desulfofarcimen acetoxidans (strain ATCC 49208 / DSM 771 / KCTC 5769 / VKM B-1644 / 5575) TaxID=485916 RepID=C8W2I8_DESAS|nr:SPFH domain-containing protein [Desulfofarcimen acetoxidans]ACV63672.1 band 7 protein [Desulfofarcimen acetoxidans DSM 771]
MQERSAWKINGFLALLLLLLLLAAVLSSLVFLRIGIAVILIILFVVLSAGMVIVQPNQAKAVTFFGKYMGSINTNGIWLTIPFSQHKKVSLRVRNFNSAKLKVNDVEGNPIEIAAVIVFRVVDSAKALFDVDNYEQFVEIQSETALRHVATKYPYDNFEEAGYSLRGNTEEVASELAKELQSRLTLAGVEVTEARLTHLAYATEIASAMLQRQQANAIIAARQKIVEGAVGMAQMAIEKLLKEGTVSLDDERKIAMINNLMVAIVSEKAAQPVINAGSLY